MLDNNKNFNHLKVHTQYSICEGAIKIDELVEYCKSNKDRNERREEEFKKEVDNALQLENDTIAFDYLSKEELMEYFKVKK